jgi:hypothetical protein
MMLQEISGGAHPRQQNRARSDSAPSRHGERSVLPSLGQGLFLGSLDGERMRLSFDPELLYTAAMFHDIGLTARNNLTNMR